MFKQRKEMQPWERMNYRDKRACLRQQRTEKDGVVMVAVETVMLGALCSCLVLSAIGSQLGQ